MKVSEFQKILRSHPGKELCFALPNGTTIPAHAHITEVGRVEKTFMDCGGQVRSLAFCSLQAWVGDDTEHRLQAEKLADIIDSSSQILGEEDLEVEVEYQLEWISQFPVLDSQSRGELLEFTLGIKNTDCLAKDVCLPAATDDDACCSGSGCC